MSRARENAGFVCENCGRAVEPVTNGSYRNHCPFCLWSKHVDDAPGDRASDCGGLMRPEALEYSGAKGWQLVFCCTACGKTVKNKVAEGTAQADDLSPMLEQMKKRGYSKRGR